MFTGVIEAVGVVTDVQTTESGLRLQLATDLVRELRLGDSLAVSGVCLTVAAVTSESVEADIGPETMKVTTLGSIRKGQAVNLERPLRADGRFGGHFVLGHVDDTGRVQGIRQHGEARWIKVGFSPALAPYLVLKGSVAVDGVSLTVAGLGEKTFDVMIVPHTWQHTNLQTLGTGDRVNLECDVVGKYVVRAALMDPGRLKSGSSVAG